MFQQLPPEAFASYDSTALADLVQEFGPEAFASFDTASLAVIKKRVPEAFAKPDTTVRQSSPPPSFQRGITKWDKGGQLWVALGPNANHWDTLIRLTPTLFVPQKPSAGAFARREPFCTGTTPNSWIAAECWTARYITPAEADS